VLKLLPLLTSFSVYMVITVGHAIVYVMTRMYGDPAEIGEGVVFTYHSLAVCVWSHCTAL
jgi:hypothetical protein